MNFFSPPDRPVMAHAVEPGEIVNAPMVQAPDQTIRQCRNTQDAQTRRDQAPQKPAPVLRSAQDAEGAWGASARARYIPTHHSGRPVTMCSPWPDSPLKQSNPQLAMDTGHARGEGNLRNPYIRRQKASRTREIRKLADHIRTAVVPRRTPDMGADRARNGDIGSDAYISPHGQQYELPLFRHRPPCLAGLSHTSIHPDGPPIQPMGTAKRHLIPTLAVESIPAKGSDTPGRVRS